MISWAYAIRNYWQARRIAQLEKAIAWIGVCMERGEFDEAREVIREVLPAKKRRAALKTKPRAANVIEMRFRS